MQVIVEAKNMTVTEALRAHVERHAQKLARVAQKVEAVRVFLETNPKKTNDPTANTATFTVEVPGKNVTVSKHAVDMYQAVIDAAHSAVRHVRKQVEKRVTKQRVAVAEVTA